MGIFALVSPLINLDTSLQSAATQSSKRPISETLLSFNNEDALAISFNSPSKRQRVGSNSDITNHWSASQFPFSSAILSPIFKPKSSTATHLIVSEPLSLHHEGKTEAQRAVLMAIFCNEDPSQVFTLLVSSLHIDAEIDDDGNTALHWAAALARGNVLASLVEHGADINRKNCHGETPLIRSISCTNNFDSQTLSQILFSLHSSISAVDFMGRNVFHHIAILGSVQTRAGAARYYLHTLTCHINVYTKDFSALDQGDSTGNTPLNIASKSGNSFLSHIMIQHGADPYKENKIGMKPIDYGIQRLFDEV